MLYFDRFLGDDQPYLLRMQTKVISMYRLLNVQAFVSLLSTTMPSLDDGDRELLKLILRGSKRKHEHTWSERHLLYNLVRPSVPSLRSSAYAS